MDNFLSALFTFLLAILGGPDTFPKPELILSTTTAEVIAVIDGDTIKVLLDNQEESVRYIGIDTPETYRDGKPACFSKEASERNRLLVAGREVSLVADTDNRDKYDRLLRYVYVDDIFVNDLLVREGYADTLTIPPNTKHKELLKDSRDSAREDSLGLWRECQN
jgi:micrococcal nuclease